MSGTGGWAPRLLDGVHDGEGSGRLAPAAADLLRQQRADWPLLAAGYQALGDAQVRPLRIRDSQVFVQHNPGRRGSTTADVAAAAAGERPCFLCPQALPPEEKGVPFGADLVVLCNPFPVLDRHLSVVHREHVPQRLAGQTGALLDLAVGLGPEYFVLYNGPRCGASAPDHLHFQACARLLPVEADAANRPLAPVPGSGGGWVLLRPEECGRSVIVFRARARDTLSRWIEAVLAGLPSPDGREPLVNLVCVADHDSLGAYLFPRARHRPAAFYAEGDERLVVSPGAIDMAGVVVVPERRDFERLDAAGLAAILQEVTLPGDEAAAAARHVRRSPAVG